VGVFGASDGAAVVVVVAEVPWLAGRDGGAAAPACDAACFDLECPCSALALVVGAVSALCLGAACSVVFAFVLCAACAGCWGGAAGV
jgi:hypothetical protein